MQVTNRKDAVRMRPASSRRPLPRGKPRAPASEAGARSAASPRPAPPRAAARHTATGRRPRGAHHRKARPARSTTLGSRLLSLREAHLKDADPHSLHRFKNNDGSVSTSERPRASQTRLKMGALPAGLAGGWAGPRARSAGATLCACATAAASHNP